MTSNLGAVVGNATFGFMLAYVGFFEMKTFNLRVRVSLEAEAPPPAQRTDSSGE